MVFTAQKEAGGAERRGGKGNVPSLQLPVEGLECNNPLLSPDLEQHLKMRREELLAVQVLHGKAEQYSLTAPAHTFRDAVSRLGP